MSGRVGRPSSGASERMIGVLRSLTPHEWITAKHLATRVEAPLTTVQRWLYAWRAAGTVERQAERGSGYRGAAQLVWWRIRAGAVALGATNAEGAAGMVRPRRVRPARAKLAPHAQKCRSCGESHALRSSDPIRRNRCQACADAAERRAIELLFTRAKRHNRRTMTLGSADAWGHSTLHNAVAQARDSQ